MNVFEAVRESGITARQAAERCGIKANRSGMAVCMFHNDKTQRWLMTSINLMFVTGLMFGKYR